MPKIGMKPIRRAALVNAAIGEIGAAGSLDVTVTQIARAAGMSPALAHHYFDGKDAMFLAAMREILARYRRAVAAEIAARPDDRLRAIVTASFAPDNFEGDVVQAWLTFYLLARALPDAQRLLRVYHRRLRSNLRHATGDAALADRIGAMIDGLYLRSALGDRIAPGDAMALVMGVTR